MLLEALKKVFRKSSYILLSTVTGLVVFAFAVWLPNLRLLTSIMSHPGISISQKINLPISLLGSIATNFTTLSASYTIVISILFGINISMVLFFLKRRIKVVKQSGVATGFFGITSGVLGMGCAACGSLLLTGVLSLFGASWILSYLPLNGGEFGILGIILLTSSIYLIAKKIQDPTVCKI